MCIKVINNSFGPIVLCLNFVFCLEKYFPAQAKAVQSYTAYIGAKIFMKTHLFDFYFLPVQTEFWEFFMLSKIKSFKKLNDFFKNDVRIHMPLKIYFNPLCKLE